MTDADIVKRDIDLDTDCLLDTDEKVDIHQDIIDRKTAVSLHGEVGDNKTANIKIDMENKDSFYIRPFPASQKEKEIIDKELQKLCK